MGGNALPSPRVLHVALKTKSTLTGADMHARQLISFASTLARVGHAFQRTDIKVGGDGSSQLLVSQSFSLRFLASTH